MNIANYTKSDRYPLSTQGLDFIQNQILTLQKISSAFGTGKYIVQGCTETNNIIAAGAVVVAGEVIEVPEQAKQETCYIRQTSNPLPSRVVRELKFGTSVTPSDNMKWTDFEHIDISNLATRQEMKAMEDKLLPKGGIIMWSGSTEVLPDGFALCDGNNNTPINGLKIPDLRGRFIVGFDAASSNDDNADFDYGRVHNTGGEAKHILTPGEMPSHQHRVPLISYTNTSGNTSDSGDRTVRGNGNYKDGERWSDWVGGNQYHENRPPYYVLAFIIKFV